MIQNLRSSHLLCDKFNVDMTFKQHRLILTSDCKESSFLLDSTLNRESSRPLSLSKISNTFFILMFLLFLDYKVSTNLKDNSLSYLFMC